MLNTFQQLFNIIPLWVYGFILVLIFLSIQAAKPKMVSIKILIYSPILFFIFSFLVIYYFLPLDKYNISAWITCCILGAMLGWIHFRDLNIKGIRNTKSIFMPGSWFVLGVIVTLLCLKLYLRMRFSNINPKLLQTPEYAFPIISVYGFTTGLILGRISFATKCIYLGPYMELEEVNALIKKHRIFKRLPGQAH